MVHVINNYNKDMLNIAYECSLEFSGISTSLEPRLFEVHQVHGVFSTSLPHEIFPTASFI